MVTAGLLWCAHVLLPQAELSYMLTKSFVFSNLFEAVAFIIIIVDIIQYYINVRNENKKNLFLEVEYRGKTQDKLDILNHFRFTQNDHTDHKNIQDSIIKTASQASNSHSTKTGKNRPHFTNVIHARKKVKQPSKAHALGFPTKDWQKLHALG